MALSPDGTRVLSAGGGGLTVWETVGGRPVCTAAHALGYETFASFSRDSRRVATVYGDRVARAALWDAATGRNLMTVGERNSTALPHRFVGNPADAPALSPDGRLLALRTLDGTGVEVWEAASGQCAFDISPQGPVERVAFLPDGRTLAVAGGPAGGILLWDLTGRRTARRQLPVASGWAELAGDAGSAQLAVWALASSPEQSVPMLRERLFRAAPPDEAVTRLVADLDAAAFARRERAEAELRGHGPAVEAVLRRALQADPGPDARRRLERLLKEVSGHGARARPARAVQVLEYANTDAATALLRELARGPADEPLACEARSALERLTR
jgi:hypothetical protein